MRKYETVFVIDSLLKAEEIENIITKYERFITDHGGQIESIDRIGKKRLAYDIKKRQYGYYVLILFDGIPSMIKQLEREYRLNESLLRFITIKLDKHALKALEKSRIEKPAPVAVEKTDKADTADKADVEDAPVESAKVVDTEDIPDAKEDVTPDEDAEPIENDESEDISEVKE